MSRKIEYKDVVIRRYQTRRKPRTWGMTAQGRGMMKIIGQCIKAGGEVTGETRLRYGNTEEVMSATLQWPST